jgi:hypothetical protein
MAATPKVSVFVSDDPVSDKETLRTLVSRLAQGTWQDFVTTNTESAGKATKFAAGIAAGGSITAYFEALSPLGWMLKGFGPLPAEFTKSGAIRVFQFTTMERALLVGKAAAAKFVVVTVAYEGGVLIGSVINQFLPESTKNDIGGTINEIVNEGGWKLLFQHPFGHGM